MRALFVVALVVPSLVAPSLADGPADNQPDNVRRIPKLGIEVPTADRAELEQGLARLQAALDRLADRKDARTRDLLPDVQVYHKAVHDALVYQEFFDAKEIPIAKSLLAEGLERAEQLLADKAPWTTQTGLVVRGYVSKIDGSVQPYGLVVPESYSPHNTQGFRLDLWFHGRGETLSELNFVQQRRTQIGTFAPRDTLVLHPYGRYSNAFKFAGEVDVLEALESVQARYRVDEDRIAVRGFSMGGAACWQFAVHYPDRWVAANPGAGFSETPEFLKFFQKETLAPAWYEEKLWHMYDCTDYAVNLSNCPTVAYSGENDVQKQAADIMEAALAKEGMELVHIIGPKTAHSYHPEARAKVDQLMSEIVQRGRQRVPRHVHLVTFTLKYNKQGWVRIDGISQHWERARVDGEVTQGGKIVLGTQNVTDLTLAFPPGWYPLDVTQPPEITVDGQRGLVLRPRSEGSLYKRHNLQGPIDDAFMDSFLFVRPTGKCKSEAVDRWVHAELDRAIEHWRRHFRGAARVKDDTAVTDADISTTNLVLWGDAASNNLIRRVAGRLPIRREGDQIVAGTERFAAEHHVPLLIYPNPLNPDRYVVLNSSFTFREYDYLNNARQVPKLPDWAIVDVRTPPGSRYPGKIVAADFFGEAWELRGGKERR
jgi:dienelactone hydrolase